MKKLFALFFLVFFSMSFYANSRCDPEPMCDNPNTIDPRGCDSYWVCECNEDQQCPTVYSSSGMLAYHEAVYYW